MAMFQNEVDHEEHLRALRQGGHDCQGASSSFCTIVPKFLYPAAGVCSAGDSSWRCRAKSSGNQSYREMSEFSEPQCDASDSSDHSILVGTCKDSDLSSFILSHEEHFLDFPCNELWLTAEEAKLVETSLRRAVPAFEPALKPLVMAPSDAVDASEPATQLLSSDIDVKRASDAEEPVQGDPTVCERDIVATSLDNAKSHPPHSRAPAVSPGSVQVRSLPGVGPGAVVAAEDLLKRARCAARAPTPQSAESMIRARDWSALNCPLIWSAASDSTSPVLEWLSSVADGCQFSFTSNVHGPSVVESIFSDIRAGLRGLGVSSRKDLVTWMSREGYVLDSCRLGSHLHIDVQRVVLDAAFKELGVVSQLDLMLVELALHLSRSPGLSQPLPRLPRTTTQKS